MSPAMRITMIVLLCIVVVAGVLLGGGLSWSLTAGPRAADISKTSELLSEMKQVSKGNEPGLVMLEKALRGARVMQIGGAALAVLDILLLVLVFKKNTKAVVVGSGLVAILGIVFFVLGVPKELDESAHLVTTVMGALALAPALFALAADKFKRPAAAVGAPAVMG